MDILGWAMGILYGFNMDNRCICYGNFLRSFRNDNINVVCVAVEFGLRLTTGLLYGFTFYNRNHHRGRRSIGD